ncbi:MAG TPA: cation transporter, partial [Chitinophagales bacterium]|nr:cation transporter [Chitinophagales bacterium]
MSIAQQTPNNKEKFFVQTLTLVVGLALLIVKFFAYFTTNSNAILTDALESIVNIVAGSFGLYSLYLAAKPNDEDHPYGHGKVEFISACIEGSLIAATGIAMIIKS